MLQDKKQPVSKVPVCPTDFVIIQVSSYENTVGSSNCFTKYISFGILKIHPYGQIFTLHELDKACRL